MPKTAMFIAIIFIAREQFIHIGQDNSNTLKILTAEAMKKP
jgi:hypothetical protein